MIYMLRFINELLYIYILFFNYQISWSVLRLKPKKYYNVTHTIAIGVNIAYPTKNSDFCYNRFIIDYNFVVLVA